MLTISNPDNSAPTSLTKIEDFYPLQPRTTLYETKQEEYVLYLGVCNDNCVFVEHEGTVHRYYLKQEAIYGYDAGSPQRVVMELKRILNAEPVGVNDDYHTGVLYDFHVQWAQPNANTKGGVLVMEIIEPLSATGWFLQAPDRKQELWIGIAPDQKRLDMIGISAAKTARSGSATELASLTIPSSISASSTTEGEAIAFQYFNSISRDGTQRPIPHSGFLLTKVMKEGKLWVTRQGEARGQITAGTADGKTYEMTIKF